ncbi:sterol desaturase family protein [Aspergillus tanneri]|uniref:Fatty acid hydroxylase domain-containing protein n=1 Tax=Aspergillus tanneri TaxID=1220188 RepID=A0A5M9M3L4_9EURO|nr:uncharacterized protein ATNIH1004_011758 [Aspergillus tanneri]KAA8641622.1 hypothetical protein ATNIH1004_011758 [Aspergillus tanneri]
MAAKQLPPLVIETCIIAATQLAVYIGYAVYITINRGEKTRSSLQLAIVHIAVGVIGGVWLTVLIGRPRDAPFPRKTLSRVSTDWPPIFEVATHITAAVLLFDIIFYVLHRLMHTRPLYALIHFNHHAFHKPSPFAVVYAHPLDYFLTQALPVMIVVRTLDAHVLTMVIVGSAGLLAAMYSHSGDLAGIMSHRQHHRQPKENFGALGISDTLAGWLVKFHYDQN